jgi:2,4-dienoyl-CoA reductase (NADPH2)
VAVVGAGGIGFDVATFLTAQHTSNEDHAVTRFCREWGIDMSMQAPGGLLRNAQRSVCSRKVYLLQRKEGRFGASLGRTTGWIHRRALEANRVELRGGVRYERIDDRGLHILGPAGHELLEVDSIVICAGQESQRLAVPAIPGRRRVHVIGGARHAVELDAERAIREGTELAACL